MLPGRSFRPRSDRGASTPGVRIARTARQYRLDPESCVPKRRRNHSSDPGHRPRHEVQRLIPPERPHPPGASFPQLLYRIDRANGIGQVSDGYHTGLGCQQASERGQVELAGVSNRNDPEVCPGLRSDLLPGNDIGMVLHSRNDDLVSAPETGPPIRLGHQVDRGGSTPGEDDFIRRFRPRNLAARTRAASNSSVARSLRW